MTIDNGPLSKQKKILCAIVIMGLIYIGSKIPEQLVVATSASIDHRIFLKQMSPAPADLAVGDYVLVELFTDIHPGCMPCLVTKKIGCAAGGRVTVKNNDEFYCDTRYLGIAKSADRNGKPLKKYAPAGPLQEDEIFLVGTHQGSYDSRYFGPMRKKDVKAKLLPIL